MKTIIKKIIPKLLLNLRHLFFAWYGAFKYKHPSEEILVIGVTGTSGKSSTCYFLKQILENMGFKVGVLSTIEFCVAGECRLNDKKMTMLGKMEIQKYLRKMVEAKCDIAIVETTSEGYLQHRHRFINYDQMILTNLYPEHIDSHGSFENYKAAKLGIFEYVANCKVKQIQDLPNLQTNQTQKTGRIPKTALVNGDLDYTSEFLKYNFSQKLTFGSKKADIKIKNLEVDKEGLSFTIEEHRFHPSLYGVYNAMNIAVAVAVAKTLKLEERNIQKAVNDLKSVPGRIEFIKEAENFDFKIIVDYAFEPVAMEELYKVVELLEPKRVIHVFGSTGGGRDKERRFTLAKIIAEKADIAIVTDEDPYDDDPMEIINDVAKGLEDYGKNLEKNYYKILDRGEAIQKAVDMAQAGDLVLVTGKGSEQKMCVAGGKMIDWDDRKKVRQALQKKGDKK